MTVKYKDMILAKNSKALELYTLWQKAEGKDKDDYKKKLDQHMKDIDRKYKELHYG